MGDFRWPTSVADIHKNQGKYNKPCAYFDSVFNIAESSKWHICNSAWKEYEKFTAAVGTENSTQDQK